MAVDKLRQLTQRVRDEVAQHNPMKPKDEASANDGPPARRTGRANHLLNTGPRVPPESGPHKHR